MLPLMCCTQYISKFVKLSSGQGLEKIRLRSNSKERQCQRMFKLPYNFVHFTCPQGDAQNPSNQASTVHEPRTSRCTSWIYKRQRNQRSNGQHLLHHRKKQESSRKNIYFCFIDYANAFDCVDPNKLWKILKEMGIPDHLTCLLRNLYAGLGQVKKSQNWTWNNGLVQNWERKISRLYIVTLLIILFAEYIMQNARLDEAQAGIEIARRNINTSDMQMIPPLWQKAKEN